jgi:Mg/Co/Ni transporter MgtE
MRVSEAMTRDVRVANPGQTIRDVAKIMPVVNRDKRLVGIVAIADIAQTEDPETTGETVAKVSEAGGQHSQSAKKK